jgi:DnaJ homologue, subfamily C, member 28, conserved domain
MTERKPAGMSFGSWIDQQINEAVERGAFDDLPGAGKPLPRRDETDAGQAWLRDYLRREGVPTEELLPAPLRLRKEAERLAERRAIDAQRAGGARGRHRAQPADQGLAQVSARLPDLRAARR